MNFDQEKEARDLSIQTLIKELNTLQTLNRDEKYKVEQMEAKEEQALVSKDKFIQELHSLDEQLTDIGKETNHQDQDLIISKLTKDLQDLNASIKQTDDDINVQNSELKALNESGQILQVDINGIEKKLKSLEDIEHLIEELHKKLTNSMDGEKNYFNENLILLQELKELEMSLQEKQQSQSQQEDFMKLLLDQNALEESNRSLERILSALSLVFSDKMEQLKEIKWVIEKQLQVCFEPDLRKIVNLDNLKQKSEKLEKDFDQFNAQLSQLKEKQSTLEATFKDKNSKDVTSDVLKLNMASMIELKNESEILKGKEHEILDIEKLTKQVLDSERDIETEFLRKFKLFKESHSKGGPNQVVISSEELMKAVDQKNQKETYGKITKFLWEIDENNIQENQNLKLQICLLRQITEQGAHLNKEIRAFYQLQFIQNFKILSKKQEQRLSIKEKLKKANDSITNLDKTIQENGLALENITKEASYLKESEFSPVKGRQSIIYGSKGDLEKEHEIIEQNKSIEVASAQYEDLMSEKDKLKKLLRQYQQKFDDLDLEIGTLVVFEELIDEISNDLDYKISDLKSQSVEQLHGQLKQLQEDVDTRAEKFRQKRQVLGQCKHEEKDKRMDILQSETMIAKQAEKFEKIERDVRNQQGYSISQETKIQFNQHIQDLKNLRQQLVQIEKENNKQKQSISDISYSLNSIGDKLVSLEDLKDILNKLQSMIKGKGLQDSIKQLGQMLAEKEVLIEQYVKDLVGSSIFDCERKFKEAEQIIERIAKATNEINNGMNDFEMDIKKGYQAYPTDLEITKEGKKLSEENIRDRKTLRQLDEQKNTIRKVLHKIKNNLTEKEDQKLQNSPSKLSAQTLEDYIQEIDTCIVKAEDIEKELPSLNLNLEIRKEDWNKILNQTGNRIALIDEISKFIKENDQSHDALSSKIGEIDKLMNGLQEISKSMLTNPDYILRRPQIQKMIDQLQGLNIRKLEIQEQMKKIEENKSQLKQASKDFQNLSIDQLQELAKQGEETNEIIKKEGKIADSILKDLTKKRQKLSDADILDNLKDRIETMNDIDVKVKNIEKDQIELEKIIQEAGKFNPTGITEAMNQLKDIRIELEANTKQRAQEMEQLQKLKDLIKNKDLSKDDPTFFAVIINGIAELKKKLQDRDQHLGNLQKKIKFLKNKYGTSDVQNQIQQFKLRGTDHSVKLQQIHNDMEILKSLFDEFDGYTSDTHEEDFIDRLGGENKEINERFNQTYEYNAELLERIEGVKKELEKWNTKEVELDSTEIERRTNLISEIEEESYQSYRQVDDLDHRVERNKKVFLAMQIKEKLKRREQEVVELQKRINQFEEQANQLELDIIHEMNEIKGANGSEQVYQALADIAREAGQNKDEYIRVAQNLKKIFLDMESLKESKHHIFDLLKANIRIKKDILQNLYKVKQLRQNYISLKSKFDTSRPKKKLAYKAIKGDYVDQLLAEWINNNNCPVPISRLGNGFYMFGTKKIFAKIINGKLVIRVGGGYMGIDEFMFYYGAQELNKMLAYEDLDGDEEIDFNEVVDVQDNKSDVLKQFHGGKTVIGNQAFKKRLSPRPGGMSGRGGSPRTQQK